MSAFLLAHKRKGQRSPYYNYINCMPTKFKTFPIFYTQKQQKQLQHTSFFNQLTRRKRQFQQDYKTVTKLLPQFKNLSYQQFIQMRLIVCSRVFGLTIRGVKTDGLVPIADMLNHKTPKLTNWYFCNQRSSFIVQNDDEVIFPGQEVCDSYGTKCNSRFLFNYGFVVPNNLSNQVEIKLKCYPSSKPINLTHRVSADLSSQQFTMLVSYYRHYQQKTQYDTVYVQQHQTVDINNIQYISTDNQYRVWQQILIAMKQKYKQFPTNSKSDQKLLENQDLEINIRNCIEIRKGEKQVLEFYIKMAEDMMDFLLDIKDIADQSIYRPYIDELKLEIGV